MSIQASQTGETQYSDGVLARRQWMLEGIIQKQATSVWGPLKGSSMDSVIFVSTDFDKGDGHEVVFQFDGNADGYGVEGKERLRGKEEQKRVFSDKLRVTRVRHALDNGDRFDTEEIGATTLSEHQDSVNKLADWSVRKSDQWVYDAGQGFLRGEGLTHIIRPNDRATVADLTSNDKMSYDFIKELGMRILTSDSYTVGGNRAPLEPVTLKDGRPMYILELDPVQVFQLSTSVDFKAYLAQTDVRGANNMMITGVLGEIDHFLVRAARRFSGVSKSSALTGSKVSIPGMREVHEDGTFTGETAFGASGVVAARGFILGKAALQIANGEGPDYKFEPSPDYGITSGSALIKNVNVQSTVLYSENYDYEGGPVAGHQFGLVGFDTYSRTI